MQVALFKMDFNCCHYSLVIHAERNTCDLNDEIQQRICDPAVRHLQKQQQTGQNHKDKRSSKSAAPAFVEYMFRMNSC